MSSRKRPGGAVGSTPARKRSRLLPSSADAASQTEPIDLEESRAPAFEPACREFIDLTGESSEPEVITVSDDESPGDREQSQQQPHVSRASENSVEPLARNDEWEPREDDGAWPAGPAILLVKEGDSSQEQETEQSQLYLLGSREAEISAELWASDNEEEPRNNNDAWPAGPAILLVKEGDSSQEQETEQSQLYLLGSREAEISAELWASDNEEEPRNNNDAWPAGPAILLVKEGDSSQEQETEQSQLYLLGSREAEISAELWASDNEEEPRNNNDAWTARLISPPIYEDAFAESQQYPLGSRAEENATEALANESGEELQDIEFRPSGSLLCVLCMSCYTQLLQVYQQQSRSPTMNSQEQVHGSGNGTGANDAPVADSAPAGQGAEEENTESSDSASSSAQQGVVIKCPICMDSYSEIMQSGRQLVATMCGHVFCSECLPIALETVGMCPNCREELTPDLYIPIYL